MDTTITYSKAIKSEIIFRFIEVILTARGWLKLAADWCVPDFTFLSKLTGVQCDEHPTNNNL